MVDLISMKISQHTDSNIEWRLLAALCDRVNKSIVLLRGRLENAFMKLMAEILFFIGYYRPDTGRFTLYIQRYLKVAGANKDIVYI